MLGHGSYQFDRDNIFSIISSTFSKTGSVAEILSIYMAKDQVFVSLYNVLKEDTIKFLNIFGGTTLDFRRGLNENQMKYTHIPEVVECFGEKTTTELYDAFFDQVVKIPSANSVRNMVRDVDIYIKLKNKKKEGDPSLIKKLAMYYGITPQEVYWSLKRVKKVLNAE